MPGGRVSTSDLNYILSFMLNYIHVLYYRKVLHLSFSQFPLSVEEQNITASDLIQQDIDINEPVGNLKKLLEPRIQISLDTYDICLQDIQVKMHTCSECNVCYPFHVWQISSPFCPNGNSCVLLASP